MNSIRTALIGLVLVGAGFVLGRNSDIRSVWAQEPAADAPSEDAAKKILAVNDALKAAVESLKQDDRYKPATKSLNVMGVLTGGINALQDLEDDLGVDPETFAGLYAGDALPEVQEFIGKDEEGRLTYKGRPVRIYRVSRLQQLMKQRKVLTGELTARQATDPATP